MKTSKQIRTIPKSEIPGLLGEIETLKARLWVRLTEWEGAEYKPVEKQTLRKDPSPILHSSIPEPQGRILRINDVVRLVGLSKSIIWKMHKEGRFPQRKNISPRSVGWLDTEIHGWIKERFGNGE
jgi:prophage regulatory protein